MKSMGSSILPAVTVLVLILIVGMYAEYGYLLPHLIKSMSAVIAVAAIGTAFFRSGIKGYPFWITLIVAYPVITPYVIRDVLGFSYYSGRALVFQEVQIEVEPMLIAALSSLFLALSITSRRIELTRSLVYESASMTNERIVWLSLAIMVMVLLAWLTEPGPTIGSVSYEEMRLYRIPGTEFAGAAWVVIAVVSLGIYLAIIARTTGRARKVAGWVYWLGVLISVIYLLMHARRSEVSGYLIFLLCVFGAKIPKWKTVGIVSVMIFSLSIIGYVRNPEVPVDNKIQNYAHLPGGPGNVLIGYIAAYELVGSGDISVFPGETYIGQIERIPPAFLGLQRPANAYDHVYEKVTLSGGEYFLIEPYMNFGIPGIVVFLVVLALLFNWLIDRIATYVAYPVGISRFIIAGTFAAMLFRMLWYGIGGTVKAMIMAAAIGLIISLAVWSVKQSRGRFVHRFC